jgi:hypothetical protein
MSADHFEIFMEELLGRRPFRAFTVRLKGGEQLEIDHARAATLVGSAVVFTGPGSIPIYFDHDCVNCIFDAPVSDISSQP